MFAYSIKVFLMSIVFCLVSLLGVQAQDPKPIFSSEEIKILDRDAKRPYYQDMCQGKAARWASKGSEKDPERLWLSVHDVDNGADNDYRICNASTTDKAVFITDGGTKIIMNIQTCVDAHNAINGYIYPEIKNNMIHGWYCLAR